MVASTTVFTETRFWLLIASSLLLPFGIYGLLLARKSVSRTRVLMLGLAMVAMAGIDVFLLQHLAAMARLSPSLSDDAVFVSELSVALYLLPAMFGGIGVNIISHVLMTHLVEAQKRHDKERSSA